MENKEKPILFNAEMVRAILDGRKTCTRRIVKNGIPNDAMWGYTMFTPKGYISCRGVYADGYGEGFYKLPYQQGNILYVRETFIQAAAHTFWYKADDNSWMPEGLHWKPSIHMPKEAARIWLRVTDVRVERLQDISNDEAIAEGARGTKCDHVNADSRGCTDCMNTGWIEPPIVEFMQIWDGTIKKSELDLYGWKANPWVWVIEFERCDKERRVADGR